MAVVRVARRGGFEACLTKFQALVDLPNFAAGDWYQLKFLLVCD
jgi:hypothetical protein